MPKNSKIQCDDILALAIACGSTLEAAAAKAGVSSKTAQRRNEDAKFQARVRVIRAEMVTRATSALGAASIQSVQTLLALQDSKIPPATRLGAARTVLELGTKLRLEGELAERVAALEKQLAE